MKTKLLKKIMCLLFAFIISILSPISLNKCYANSELAFDIDTNLYSAKNFSIDLEAKTIDVLRVIRSIGVMVAVITISIIGIRFMVGSVEQKAQYKEILVPWTIGAILFSSVGGLVLTIANIFDLTDNVMQDAESGQEIQNVSFNFISSGINNDIQNEDKKTVATGLNSAKYGSLDYWIYGPDMKALNLSGDLSLIVFLHGGGECGSMAAQKEQEPFYLLGGTCKAVVLMPHSYTNNWVESENQIIGLINNLVENYNIDKNRIAITGFSMGATGAWEIALRHPDYFSCVVPISGWGYVNGIKYTNPNFYSGQIPDCPIWIINDSTLYGGSDLCKMWTRKIPSSQLKVQNYSGSHTTSTLRGIYRTLQIVDWMIEPDYVFRGPSGMLEPVFEGITLIE